MPASSIPIANFFELDTRGFDDRRPILESARALTSTRIRATFNTGMIRGDGTGADDILNPANFSLVGPSATIQSVEKVSFKRVDLVVTEMVQGAAYTLSAAATVESVFGKVISATGLSAAFTGIGQIPQLADINPLLDPAGTNVRVIFSEIMEDNAALSNTANYLFTALGGATPIVPSLVTPEAGGSPTFVDVTVSAMDLDGQYVLQVINVEDTAGNGLSPDTLQFTGFKASVKPTVVSAVAIDGVTVDVTFSQAMLLNSDLLTPENYAFSGGLQAIGVEQTSPTVVRLETSPQALNKLFTLTVNTVVQDTLSITLNPLLNIAQFLGLAPPVLAFISGLIARSHPDGLRVDLEWTNPVGTTHTRILRKSRGFSFDENDGIVIYDDVAIETYEDSADLLANHYFYYTVLASTDGGTTFTVFPESRVEGLSIGQFNSFDFLKKNIPQWYFVREAQIVDGTSLLTPTVRTLAAAVDILRGEIAAFRHSANQDRSIGRILQEYNRSLNFEPDDSFDFAALRRIPLHLLEIYKRKTTIPAICQFVEVFTEWFCTIVDFGGPGGTIFRTWDGLSQKDTGQGNDGGTLTVARGSLTDSSKTFPVDKWRDGLLIDAMGNIMNVVSNTADTITIEPKVTPSTTVNGTSAVGTKILFVATTAGLQPHSKILIVEGANFQVATVKSLVPNFSLTIQEDLQFTFTSGALVFEGTDVIDGEVVGVGTQVSSGGLDGLRDTDKHWVQNQWRGYSLLDSANTKFTIERNTADEVFVTSGTPVAGDFAIAFDFTLGGSFALRDPIFFYAVYAGEHHFLFEATWSLALIGTADDPFDRLYGGLTSLGPGFTPNDFGIFISPGVALAVGASTDITLNTLTDTDALLTPAALVGKWLNPNRRQRRLFKIRANTATTIDIGQSMEGLSTTGDAYFVLDEQDALKYSRLHAVLPKFHPKFARAHIFFE